MILETKINLKNKNKEELIMFLNESLQIIKKQENAINTLTKASNKWFAKTVKQDEEFTKERNKLNNIIDTLITALAEERGTDEDEIREVFINE